MDYNMIEEEALHPITCLSSLANNEKRLLLDQRIVLCSSIKDNPQLLKSFLGESFNIDPVLAEIGGL